jgi:hypothetical protein
MKSNVKNNTYAVHMMAETNHSIYRKNQIKLFNLVKKIQKSKIIRKLKKQHLQSLF